MFHSTLSVDKVELPKKLSRQKKLKIDKLILPLYPFQLRWVLFSRSKKEMVFFFIKKTSTIPSNSVHFNLGLN